MKITVVFLFFFLTIARSYGQTDKTRDWKYEEVYGAKVEVNIKSPIQGENHYEVQTIVAPKGGNLRLQVIPQQKSIVQVSIDTATAVNELIGGARTFNFKVKKQDTVTIFFVAYADKDNKASFNYDYYFGEPVVADSSKLVIYKDPKKAFEQLLSEARYQFVHLLANNEKDKRKDVEYPDGLFYKFRAVKDRFWITQYTAMHIDKASAEKNNAEWNRKIAAWLKDYKITSVTQTGDKYQDETNYIKKSPNGYTLFQVTVFRRQEEGYNCGVRISAR